MTKLETWIKDGEKYSLICLQAKIEENIPLQEIVPNLWVSTDAVISLPDQWKEWLGSSKVEELQGANLFLLSKQPSANPEILDNENNLLCKKVWHFYTGLLLSSTFAPAHHPVMLTGSRMHGEVGIRQQHDIDPPIPSLIVPYPAILADDLRQAAYIAKRIGEFEIVKFVGGHWRFVRTLTLYTEARTIRDILDRLHQFCRCIDGLILPAIGKTKKEFKSKTELFIGTGHHELMGKIYDIRSAVEHLHENKYLETFDREIRLDILKKEAIVGYIARTAIARILSKSDLWQHFANTEALAKFWELPEAERKKLWGSPVNITDAVTDLDPQFINNYELGAVA